MTSANKAFVKQRIQKAIKVPKLRSQDFELAEQIEREHSLSPIVSRVLAARGIKDSKVIKSFIAPSLKHGLENPEKLIHFKEACAEVAKHVENGGGIAICCDFDVDGLTSGSMLSDFLRSSNVENVNLFVPHRMKDGYGLHDRMIDEAIEKNCTLLITLDFGTSNEKELAYAKSKGLSTIVIDHHHVEVLPKSADFFINPKQENCGFASEILCAAGLTWYFLIGLKKSLKSSIDVREYLDLAALGTVCDMVPLRESNRVIVARGLKYLENTERSGLKALKKILKIKAEVKTSHIGFGIGPRINAAGRMKNPEAVIDLLTCSNDALAKAYATELHELNAKRQVVEEKMRNDAMKRVYASDRMPSGIVVWDESYHTGVVGIIAQRLLENFYRPSVVIGAFEDTWKGSVRGIPGLNIVEILNECSKYLISFGGHDRAGGLAIAKENIESFAELFDATCAEHMKGVSSEPIALADVSVDLEDLKPELVKSLSVFSPFGIGNPHPLIELADVTVKSVSVIKQKHLRVTFTQGKNFITGLMWGETRHPYLKSGSRVRVVAKPEINNFQGRRSAQLIVYAASPYNLENQDEKA